MKTLKLSLVGLVAALCMGSGGGNPGCDQGSYESPVCDSTCDNMAGTYRMSFEDSSAPSKDCDRLGLVLPSELVLTRQGDVLATQLSGQPLSGHYDKDYLQPLQLSAKANVSLSSMENYTLWVEVQASFVKVPATAQEPATLRGQYRAYRQTFSTDTASDPQCDINRAFTATR